LGSGEKRKKLTQKKEAGKRLSKIASIPRASEEDLGNFSLKGIPGRMKGGNS